MRQVTAARTRTEAHGGPLLRGHFAGGEAGTTAPTAEQRGAGAAGLPGPAPRWLQGPEGSEAGQSGCGSGCRARRQPRQLSPTLLEGRWPLSHSWFPSSTRTGSAALREGLRFEGRIGEPSSLAAEGLGEPRANLRTGAGAGSNLLLGKPHDKQWPPQPARLGAVCRHDPVASARTLFQSRRDRPGFREKREGGQSPVPPVADDPAPWAPSSRQQNHLPQKGALRTNARPGCRFCAKVASHRTTGTCQMGFR